MFLSLAWPDRFSLCAYWVWIKGSGATSIPGPSVEETLERFKMGKQIMVCLLTSYVPPLCAV